MAGSIIQTFASYWGTQGRKFGGTLSPRRGQIELRSFFRCFGLVWFSLDVPEACSVVFWNSFIWVLGFLLQ